MNIDVIAQQIRTLAPIFNGNVAGAAAYANSVVDQAWLPLPAAYVIPLSQEADENEVLNGLQQTVHERIGIIVVLETVKIGGAQDFADRRAQAASAYIDTVKYALFRAILNWRPDWTATNYAANKEARGLMFTSADFPADGAFDRARFFYQFNFTLETTLTEADGWQLFGDPILSILATLEVERGSGSPAPQVDVSMIPAPVTT